MKQKLDYMFVCCATCRYWSGNVTYLWPGTVEVDVDQRDQQNGTCNNTYMGRETFCFSSCPNWERKFRI